MNQFKTGQDFEIYETDYMNNTSMQEIYNVKQPVIFRLDTVEPSLFDFFTLDNIHTTTDEMIQVKDTHDYTQPDTTTVDSIFLPYPSALNLMRTDTRSHYFTENNFEFVEEGTLLDTKFDLLDSLLKPNFTIQKKYDLLFGSNNVETPLRYHTDDQRFLLVMNSKITVRMTPWKSSKFIRCSKDYDNYEFWGYVSPKDTNQMKYIEFDVMKGSVLYIPSYWWYSIRFVNTPGENENGGENEPFIVACTYNSIVNKMANLPDIMKYYLQQQNTTTKIGKPITSPVGIESITPPATIADNEKETQLPQNVE
jgi:hypothetical protein